MKVFLTAYVFMFHVTVVICNVFFFQYTIEVKSFTDILINHFVFAVKRSKWYTVTMVSLSVA